MQPQVITSAAPKYRKVEVKVRFMTSSRNLEGAPGPACSVREAELTQVNSNKAKKIAALRERSDIPDTAPCAASALFTNALFT